MGMFDSILNPGIAPIGPIGSQQTPFGGPPTQQQVRQAPVAFAPPQPEVQNPQEQAPATTPEEQLGAWQKFQQKLSETPGSARALMAFGAALMQPGDFGKNLGQGLMAFQQMLTLGAQEKREAEQQDFENNLARDVHSLKQEQVRGNLALGAGNLGVANRNAAVNERNAGVNESRAATDAVLGGRAADNAEARTELERERLKMARREMEGRLNQQRLQVAQLVQNLNQNGIKFEWEQSNQAALERKIADDEILRDYDMQKAQLEHEQTQGLPSEAYVNRSLAIARLARERTIGLLEAEIMAHKRDMAPVQLATMREELAKLRDPDTEVMEQMGLWAKVMQVATLNGDQDQARAAYGQIQTLGQSLKSNVNNSNSEAFQVAQQAAQTMPLSALKLEPIWGLLTAEQKQQIQAKYGND